MTGRVAVWRRMFAVVAAMSLLGLSGVTFTAVPAAAAGGPAAAHRAVELVEFTVEGRVIADLPSPPRAADAGPVAIPAVRAGRPPAGWRPAGPAVAMWTVRAAHAHGRRGRAPPLP